jgi:Signal transduction histidine kinase
MNRLAPLRVPLAAKIVGANLLVIAILIAAWIALGGEVTHFAVIIVFLVVALHLGLVAIALRPIRDLEIVASRVWQGDYGARVQRSSVADHEVLRVGKMFNILLDDLAADRARMRTLATEVIAAGDRERAAIARELHDSTAQHVAALLLQLATTARDVEDEDLADRLREARDTAEGILDELRALSHTVHPAVLDDLGLEAALRKLARDASSGTGIGFDVSVEPSSMRVPREVEAVLFRVAQEAVRNATRHASPQNVRITLHRQPGAVSLEVRDDGRGFDLPHTERVRPGMGLVSMRERLELVDGMLSVETAPGDGTAIRATIPLAGG